MGEGTWKGLYSLVSLVALALMIWGYAQARPEADILYVPPVWGRHLAWLLMLLRFHPDDIQSCVPAGFKALTRHPFLAAVILWSARAPLSQWRHGICSLVRIISGLGSC